MALIGGGVSRIAAAVDGRGGVSSPSRIPTGDRQESWAFDVSATPPGIGSELSHVIGPPEAYWTHRGAIEIVGQQPRVSRNYGSETGSQSMLAAPPIPDPSIVFSALKVTNGDEGMGNWMGEQGYALHVAQGVSRFDGPVWGGNWMVVDAIGNIQDRLAGELGAGVDDQHYYAHGTVCGDSKGRDPTDTPITVYYPDESGLPDVGDVVFSGLRDQSGIPWGSTVPGSRKAYGQITTGWSWVTGYENSVGRFYFNPCSSPYGSNLDTTRLLTAVALSGSGTDPNGQVGVIFAYSRDTAGNRLADSPNVYDDKIGTIKDWGSTLTSIPKGWSLVTSAALGAGNFIVGYKQGSDYDPPGTTGGSHPITPDEHTDLSTIDDHSPTVYSGTTHITIDDHPADVTSTDTTGISINDHPADVTSTDGTGISINGSGILTSEVSLTGISVLAHAEHYHKGLDDGWFVNRVGGAESPGNTSIVQGYTHTALAESSHIHAFDVGFFYKVSFDPDTWLSSGANDGSTSTSLSHTVADSGHDHDIASHIHTITDGGHYHDTPLLTHIITDPGHYHDTPSLSHVVNDPGHDHGAAVLTHSGTIAHSSQDFRPPFATQIRIIRVGPNDD